MTATLIRFPTNRVVRARLVPCGKTDAARTIDRELRSIEHAIRALQRQHRSLLARYRFAVAKVGREELL